MAARHKAAILAANGPSVLELGAGSATPASVMRVLRQVRPLSLAQARSMADELLRAGLRGTLVEMELLARSLRASGAVASIRSSHTDVLLNLLVSTCSIRCGRFGQCVREVGAAAIVDRAASGS